MRITTVSTLIFLLLLSACGGPTGVPIEKVPVVPASVFLEAEHLFSNPLKEDKFLLGYYGASVLDTTVHLYVLSAMGDTMYHDSWESGLFLGPEEQGKADSTKADHILAGMRKVLDKQMPMLLDTASNAMPENRDFSYQVGSHGHVLTWSDVNNAVMEKE